MPYSIALPFRYKRIMTKRNVKWSIANPWLLGLALATYVTAGTTYDRYPQYGICNAKISSASYIPVFIVLCLLVVSISTIIGISIYLRYKIIHSNRFFKV